MNLLFSFNGRIGRAKFWLTQLGMSVIGGIIGGIIGAMGAAAQPNPNADPSPALIGIGIAFLVLMIPLLWGSLAIGAKRCHDRGRSGWWQLLFIVPLANIWLLIDLGFLRGVTETNEWGPPAVPRDAAI